MARSNNINRQSKSKNKKPKRLRKSSFNKITKSFQVFNNDSDHYNKYENLTLDVSDSEDTSTLPILSSNNSSSATLSNEIPSVDVFSSDNEDVAYEMNSKDAMKNHLELNTDFIPFSDDSEEEEEDDLIVENTNVEEEAEIYGNERSLNNDYPWLLNHDHSKQRDIIEWLTLEIKDFVAYISPSREEIKLRNKAVSKLGRAIKELWSDSELLVFGSYATDLYLPGSDIDCVVNSASGNKEHRSYLYELARFLKKKNLATSIEVIARARVPIIKFIEPESGVHIDISFERTNGVEAAKLIREWLDMTPGLRELVLIVKQFLTARRLNDVHTGGLGGFSIICLVYSFLHLHPKLRTDEIDPLENLGVLLIDFFELYGKNFAYDEVALSFISGYPSYMPKSNWGSLPPSRSSFTLAIQDPGDASNNLSRGSFNVRDIKKSFSGAFELLTSKCFEMDASTFKDRVGKSILGNVIKYKGKQRDFKDERDLVVNRAIIENELYHRKRSSSYFDDDLFLDPSADEALVGQQDELELYSLDQPVKKKVKKSTKTLRKLKKIKQEAQKKEEKPQKSIDSFMGLSDDENNGDSDSKPKPQHNTKEDKRALQTKTVDAQTRRDYWLSKGQTLASPTIPKKST
ncbi:hypothetical protein KAFR_0A08370 [Kazachstania africana CBS 2517]|uniref:polynucleotide adenylyltransferase n=1 Tax=Kazachstania africana (strain ATCC 22294 / BCRC 22015 / CBS 2517 / CECT 1963 / NBRC 1671 / NRRL Y-8276) TaxID=1071382 RepID=H2APH1_KAZAF|nr:hypothetical protein KAFR_0A08370 [Kazachstania africana CBS 2517]CCF56271.1 hypothetical protein KAFR_0A08370 [Kazachstania africana CBS 2517]